MDAARGIHSRLPQVSGGLSRAFAPAVRSLERIDRASAAWHRVLVAAGLLAPLLVLYRQLLFGGEPWLDFDLLVSYQPRYQLLAAGLMEGRIPLWTGGTLGGFPIAFSEFGWFYPLTWLLLRVLDPLRAYCVELAVGLTLAAAAAYWLARVWGLARLPAFLAAFLFTYGPFVFATSRFLNYADIFFALPAGIAAIELVARGRRRYAALLAVTTGIMAIAGHPQVALLFAYAWIILGLFRLWWTWRDRGARHTLRLLGWLLPAAAIGLGLAAVRLLPTIENTALSARAGGLDFAVASQGSIPPWSLALGYLFPSFEIPRVLDDTLNAEELLYLGMLTPALALLALGLGWRRRLVRFMAVLVIVSWVLAMGSSSLGFPLIHKLPLFGFFRQPARFGMVASFGLAFLAGLGLDLLRRPEARQAPSVRWLARAGAWLAGLIGGGTVAATIVLTGFAFLIVPYGYDYIDRVIVGSEGRFLTAERYYHTFDQLYGRMEAAFSLTGWAPRLVLIAVGLSALALWQYRRGRLAPRHAQWAVVAVLVFDVLLAPGHAVPTVPEAWYAREAQATSAMDSASSPAWRVFSYRGLAQKFELSTATGGRLTREQRDLLEYLLLNETLTPNLPLSLGLQSIDGYENLMSQRAADYLAYVGSERATVAGFASDPELDQAARHELLAERVPVLAAANVRYVTSGVALDIPGLRPVHEGMVDLPDWAGVEQPIHVYEVEEWRPRAFVARTWRIVGEDEPIEDRLEALAHAPTDVVLDREPGIAPPGPGAYTDEIGEPVVGPERLSLSVDLAAPGILVVNEALYPGWTATIDGRPAELLAANVLMRGVAVDAGPHSIEMRYEPPHYRAGAALSLAAVGLTLALLAAGVWVDRR